jgi:hypothetical protein
MLERTERVGCAALAAADWARSHALRFPQTARRSGHGLGAKRRRGFSALGREPRAILGSAAG